MKNIKCFLLLLLAIVVILPAQAADRVDSKIRFNDLYGEVKIRPNTEEDDSYEFAEFDTVIYEDDRIKTEEESGAILGLEDMSTYVIKPESVIVIHTEDNNVSKLEMIAGAVWGNVKKMAEGKSIELEMSHCVAGIKGTSFRVTQSRDGLINIIEVLRGLIEARLKDGTIMEVPSGHKLEITPKIKKLIKLQVEEVKKIEEEIEKDLEDMDGKLDEEKLNNKLLKQTSDIIDTNSKLESTYKSLREQKEKSYKAKNLNELVVLSKKFDTLALQASRYKGALKEADATIAVAKKRLNTSNNPSLLKSSIENEVKAIAECLITILNIEQLKLELLNSIDELKGEDGQDNSYSKNLEEKIESLNSDVKRLVDSLSDGSSYSSFKDAIDYCESYLNELKGLASEVKDSRATTTCKQKFTSVLNYIQKSMKDFASVPEIDSALKKNLNDIEKDVPTYASDVRKYLNEYNSLERNGSPESKKRFVETVSRMLTGYDRMGRFYTKANRMITKIDKSFKFSAYKTSDYLECKESWEKIEQAMTELDRQASELSSCVENLKSQLEALLGGQ